MNDLSDIVNFEVNQYPIRLGTAFSTSELKQSKFKKLGVLGKLMIKPGPGEIIWRAKNSTFIYLSSIFNAIVPILNPKYSMASMFGTTAYVTFRSDKLDRFVFQVLANRMAVENHLGKFITIMTQELGQPENLHGKLFAWELGR